MKRKQSSKKAGKQSLGTEKLISNKSSTKVRYAVAGLGYIAQQAVLPAFKHAKNSELTALISSDPDKLDELGEKYGVQNLFLAHEYEDCLKSGLVDAVYLAVPNSMHCTYTVAAAEAGIHVLCEKPMAISKRECQDMVAACEQHNVKLMIAYRLHFDKANLKSVEACRSGKLGELRFFSSTFSYPITDENNIRLKDHLGGGPLFDLGIYCINAARYLFQSEPLEVIAMEDSGERDHRFDKVEEAVAATLRFHGGKIAQFICSFGGAETSSFQVVGDKGILSLDPAFDFGNPLKQEVKAGKKTKSTKFPKTDQFGPELTYFADCILKDSVPEPAGMEGLIDVAVINAIYESIDRRMPIPLPGYQKLDRPSLELVREYPPIHEEKLFHAVRPSR